MFFLTLKVPKLLSKLNDKSFIKQDEKEICSKRKRANSNVSNPSVHHSTVLLLETALKNHNSNKNITKSVSPKSTYITSSPHISNYSNSKLESTSIPAKSTNTTTTTNTTNNTTISNNNNNNNNSRHRLRRTKKHENLHEEWRKSVQHNFILKNMKLNFNTPAPLPTDSPNLHRKSIKSIKSKIINSHNWNENNNTNIDVDYDSHLSYPEINSLSDSPLSHSASNTLTNTIFNTSKSNVVIDSDLDSDSDSELNTEIYPLTDINFDSSTMYTSMDEDSDNSSFFINGNNFYHNDSFTSIKDLEEENNEKNSHSGSLTPKIRLLSHSESKNQIHISKRRKLLSFLL